MVVSLGQLKKISVWKIKLSLFITYLVFAILLNSVGALILELVNHYHISRAEAGNLDAYKDITIVVFSFIVGAYLPRLGYKTSMLIGLAIASLASFLTPVVNTEWMIRLLLVCVGMGFALVKVCLYSTIGLITRNEQQHACFTNLLEGIFMVGVLGGYWIFGFFMGDKQHWLNTFYYLGGLSTLAFLILASTPFKPKMRSPHKNNKNKPAKQDFIQMIRLTRHTLVMIFVVSIFAYVFIEQGVSTWLPTFNNQVVKLTPVMSMEVTSILSGAYAVGRLTAGFLLRRVQWNVLLCFCLITSAVLMVVLMPHQAAPTTQIIHNWSDAPWRAYLFPLIGIFLAPLYPILCSTLLSATAKKHHSAMMSLIMIFSALGGSVGSKLTGIIFGYSGGENAITLSLIPILVLLVLLFPYSKLRKEKFMCNGINDEITETLPTN